MRILIITLLLGLLVAPAAAETPLGYYRTPAIHGETIVFAAEGDLWKVGATGGVATRLTSHPGTESTPAISPDGGTLAFVAQYEGPVEVYTMPLAGGLPTRRTFDGGRRTAVGGWTPEGQILYATDAYATLPSIQLATIDPATGERVQIPLAQASDGVYDDQKTLYFTRLPFQGSQTKRYTGGTAQNIWKFAKDAREATLVTVDYAGTSKRPMWWNGRLYFASDRDGTMNLWSMTPDGGDLRQLTHHSGFDVASPSLDGGRIVYQLGADLHLYDIAANTDRRVPITLSSDFDQTREIWVSKPMEYLTAAHISPNGDRVVLTARGRVFVAPATQGRFVEASRHESVRYRDARFLADGKSLVALSDKSGEIELWTLAANGVTPPMQLTRGGDVLRWESAPSPDGAWIAHHDKNQRLWLYNTRTHTNRKVDESDVDNFSDLRWSPDSRWLAYVAVDRNLFRRIKVCRAADGMVATLTTDRFDSFSPAWSPDGKWLYFLSDRSLHSLVSNPWGKYQPEPFLTNMTRIYQAALRPGIRSPFHPRDELQSGSDSTRAPSREKQPAPTRRSDGEAFDGGAAQADAGAAQQADLAGAFAGAAQDDLAGAFDDASPQRRSRARGTARTSHGARAGKNARAVDIDFAGVEARLVTVPVPPGNYTDLAVTDKALFWLSTPTEESKANLVGAPITNEDVQVTTILSGVTSVEMSQDRKKLLVQKGDNLYILDATVQAPTELEKKQVPLSGWALSIVPREEWRQMFVEAWRLERDYFYDRSMHGVDWKATLARYLPLVDRVSTRAELSDLIAQMVGELSALHTFVYGGYVRTSPDNIRPASLGAQLVRDAARGGYRVTHVYSADPDEPTLRSPLAEPGVEIRPGDVIEAINGVPTLSVPDYAELLRQKSGAQVLLHVRSAAGRVPTGQLVRDVIVTPISADSAANLRYAEWEYTRRMRVDSLSHGEIGYVHLRAMGGDDYSSWAKNFYPVFTRQGLIVDVRNNTGGNIDSWILEKLLRKAWFYWSARVGQPPVWNMQYAFRGHVVVLCNERTASDGEAFCEGARRLGIGKVLGTRTWGGEIWLSSSNVLVDKGIATAAEAGVYGPDGDWLIEGHGVVPDIVVDNLPHATFLGEDAQLAAAVAYLQHEIKEHPVPVPPIPKYPNKAFQYPVEQSSGGR
jgi:tricorn protease